MVGAVNYSREREPGRRGSGSSAADELAGLIERFAGTDGVHPHIRSPSLPASFVASNEQLHAIQEPAVCPRGAGPQAGHRRDIGLSLRSRQVPDRLGEHCQVGQILEAGPPLHSVLRLDLDPAVIGALMLDPRSETTSDRSPSRHCRSAQRHAELLDAAVRLVQLAVPRDISILAPLADGRSCIGSARAISHRSTPNTRWPRASCSR